MLTVGGASVVTVMPIVAEVVASPRLSVATAVSDTLPALVGFQLAEYGDVVEVPTAVPLAKKSTLATVPSLSAAVALMETVVPTRKPEPALGDVILTEGGLFEITLTWTEADVAANPKSSVATAVHAYDPDELGFQANV